MRRILYGIVFAVLIAVLCYIVTAFGIYRFDHPRMTETELFLHIPDALSLKNEATP